MLIIKLISVILLSISILMKNPMSMILTLTSMVCVYATFIFESINNSWIPMMIIMTMVGGLMILYVFVICLTPNEKKTSAKLKSVKIMILFLTAMMMTKVQSEKTSEFSMAMYNFSWSFIVMMILIIISCMIAMLKMIYSKNKSIKSMK